METSLDLCISSLAVSLRPYNTFMALQHFHGIFFFYLLNHRMPGITSTKGYTVEIIF
jgi:hypothetical protein